MNKTCPVDAYQKCLYFSSGALSRSLDRLAQGCFAALGMSPSHVYLLKLVIDHPGNTPGYLAEVLSLAPSTVTRFADALERKGLIKRHSVGKQVELLPTEAGEEHRQAIAQGAEKMMAAFEGTIGFDKAMELSEQLSAVAKTFDDVTT